ncbi:MAG TPA: hypothetical protein VFE30_14495 [Anaeromyxobacteraceae bacterium]|nr:hypothetical protein [Anaeromyxobacteraceae bacterium]
MILVCAATGTEAGECRRGLAGAAGFEVLAVGVGPERAAAALSRRLSGPGARPALVVSAGFAGALTPGLPPLFWATASALYRLDGGRAVPVALPPGALRVAAGATACAFLTAGEVLSAGAPAALTGPLAVDMESAGLAEVAAAAGIPAAVLRLVTDAPERPLPPLAHALAGALGARGLAARATHAARAAAEAARHPAQAAAFLRDTASWRERLREGWRERAARGFEAELSPGSTVAT